MGSSRNYTQPPENPALGSNPYQRQGGWAGIIQASRNAAFKQKQNLLMAEYKPVGSQMIGADGSSQTSYDAPQPQLNVGTYQNTIEQPKTTFNPYFGNYLNY